jgi:Ca-activated chloride channel family protein
VSEPGTDIARALRMARRVMPQGRREEQVIVIWTDGEDLEQEAEAAIDEIAGAGVRVFAVGVGTPAGDVVPVLDEQGRAIDVKRDASGGTVRSRLDQALLQTLARKTRGAYFAASQPGGELPRLLSALGTVSRSARGERLVERPVARFTLLAGLAFLLLLLERIRTRRRLLAAPEESSVPAVTARGAGAAAVLLAGLFLPGVVHAQSAWAKGDDAFRKGRYAEAESLYAKRLEKGGPDAVRVNLTTARALSGSAEGVDQALAQLSTTDDDAGRAAGYNLGTHLGEANDIDRGLEELRRSLERDPSDDDARWNYEVLLQRKRQEQEQPQQQQPDEQQQQREDEQRQQGASGQAPPRPQQGAPQPQQSTPPQQSSSSTPHEGMDRAQAERLLGALEELQRLERQRQRRVRMVQEKPGRDW